jgi:hypothetical protein
MLGATLCLIVLTLAAPGAGVAKLLPEAEKLAECFSLADWTLAAGEALRAGASKEEHSIAPAHEAASQRKARRAAIEAVDRDRPRDLSDYIAAKLGACLRERGVDSGELSAKACYDQTLWAGMLFASKRRGVALEQLIRAYDAAPPLAGLAEEVYRTHQPEADFRRDLFLACVSR